MKSRIKMALTALVVLACFIDWPVSSNAQAGRIVKGLEKGAKEARESGLFKSCSETKAVEENVNKATQDASQMNINPAAVGAGMNAVKKANASNNNYNNNYNNSEPQYIQVTCPDCNGQGSYVGNDGYEYVCTSCNGNGVVLVEQ